jgi:MFS family permease
VPGIERAMSAPVPFTRQRAFALLFAVMLVTASGNTALQSVLPAIGRELKISDLLIASIFSLSALLWTVSAPYWARQTDRLGRKRLVLVGLAGFFASMLLSALVVGAGLLVWIGPLLVFILFTFTRSLYGLFGSAANPSTQAYVAAHTRADERTGAISLLSSAFGLGTILGPAIAPFFVVIGGLSGPLYAFAAVAVGMAYAVWRYLPDGEAASASPKLEQPATRLRWRDPRIQPFIVYGFVVGSVQAAIISALGFVIIDEVALPPATAQPFIGVAMMAGAFATLLAQWGLIRMLRMTPAALLLWGAALACVGAVLAALAPNYSTHVIAFALMSLGFGFARPGFTAGASLAVRADEQDAVAGAVSSINGACYIAAPAIGILLYHAWMPLPFLAAALLMLALTVMALRTPIMRQSGTELNPERSYD